MYFVEIEKSIDENAELNTAVNKWLALLINAAKKIEPVIIHFASNC